MRSPSEQGMLVSENTARQRELAQTPGAVQRLLQLVRAQDDADVHHAAASVFALLAKNAELKGEVAAALRASTEQAEQAQAPRFL